MLSRIVYELLRIIGPIFAFDRGVPLFNALVGGDLLNSQPRQLASEN